MKTNLDKFFKMDESLEKDGVWFEVSEKTGFLLRPFNAQNQKIKGAMAAHYKPFARQIENGTLDAGKDLEIRIKLFTTACLAEWRGVEIDGAEAACTPENSLKLFKSLPHLFETLWKHANDSSNYKEELGNF